MTRSVAEIEAWLTERIAAMLALPPASIDRVKLFDEYGLDSERAIELTGELEQWLGVRLDATQAWDYPSIAALAEQLGGKRP